MTMRWLGLTAALVGAGALHLPGAHPSDFGVCPSPLSARARSPRRVCARRLSTAALPCQPPAAAGEAVPLKVNKLWSAKTQLTYDFYSLPCVNQAPTPCLSLCRGARAARASSAAAGAAGAHRRCLGRTRNCAAMRALASGRPRLRRARPRSHSRRGLGGAATITRLPSSLLQAVHARRGHRPRSRKYRAGGWARRGRRVRALAARAEARRAQRAAVLPARCAGLPAAASSCCATCRARSPPLHRCWWATG